MLTVIEPAATTALTTLDRVKLSLGITDDADDEYLEMMIAEQSDYVCSYLNVAMADDGTRTLGLETLEETLFVPMLSRLPVVEILSMADGNGEAFDPADYLVNPVSGRFMGPPSTRWMNLVYNFTPPPVPLVVTYKAGWLLPGDDGRNLPPVIESGCMSLISTYRAGRGRDPLAKSETIPGVISTEYWVGPVGGASSGASGMPPDIASRLSFYRRHVV
jgi:hypothetical protein